MGEPWNETVRQDSYSRPRDCAARGRTILAIRSGGGYRRSVEAYKRELLAKGEKLKMTELAPPATNDEARAALFMGTMNGYQAPTNLPSMMKMVASGVAAVGHARLAPDQMADYENNVNLVARLREILGTNILGFNLDYSQGMNILLPHLAKVKSAEQLAAGTAMQALATNDPEEAHSSLLLAVDVARLDDKNPLMICDLVRIAMARIALNATWEALQSGEWSEPQLAELQARSEDMDLFERLVKVMEMERAWDIAAISELRKTNELGGLGLFQSSYGSSGSSGNAGLLDELRDKLQEFYDRYPRYWKWRSTWSYDEELFILQADDAALESLHEAKATGAMVPALREFDQQYSKLISLHHATNHFELGLDLSASLKTYFRKVATAETARRLAVTAIALKRYQLAHNTYPASLGELVPAFLSHVPNDLMDGKPLRYRLEPDGSFLLYSVGEDGKDDGGDPTYTGPSTTKDWTTGRDMVWPRAATPKEVEDFEKRGGALGK